MYIEKNGYVVMDIEQMNFLDRNSEFSEDIEDAEIFEEYAIAKETSDSLNEDLWSLLKLDIINMDDKYVSSELVSEIEKDGVVLYEKV